MICSDPGKPAGVPGLCNIGKLFVFPRSFGMSICSPGGCGSDPGI